MFTLPHHLRAVIDALRLSDPPRNSLRSLTDSEWASVLSHWGWVRLTLPLRQVRGNDLPEWVRAQIDENVADNMQRLECIKTLYVELAHALGNAGVDHLVLKGFAQWPAYMQGPQVRTQSDIDVFCPAESAFRGRDALCALGYRWRQDLRPRFSDHLPALEKSSQWRWRGRYFDPAMPVTVEVHFQFWDEIGTRLRPIGLQQLWLRRAERPLDGFTCPALDEVDSLAYAALHVIRSLFCGDLQPYNIYEIAWFLHTNADNKAFWGRWRQLHHESLRRLEAVCFTLAKQWFACRLAEELEEDIESLPGGAQRWFYKYSDSPLIALVRPNKDALWLHLSLLDSSSDKRSIFRNRVFPAPNRPSEPVKRWTLATFSQYVIHAICRGLPLHLSLLPRTLLQGIGWWWDNRSARGLRGARIAARVGNDRSERSRASLAPSDQAGALGPLALTSIRPGVRN